MSFKLLSTSILILLSCRSKPAITPHSYVGIKDMTQEVTRSVYIKKKKSYFIVTGSDTSAIKFEFKEAKHSQKCNIHFRDDQEHSTVTYRQKMEQLKTILSVAAKDFKLDSLNVVTMRTLNKNGDIAIDVTEEYMKLGFDKIEYPALDSFMKESRLAKDMNELFVGYGIKVKEFHLEKCHYSSKVNLLHESVIERDTATIPDRIIDCITGIAFEPIR